MKTLLLFMLISFQQGVENDEVKVAINDLSEEFKVAMKVRDFVYARHVIHEMIPLMRQDIRLEKKIFNKTKRGKLIVEDEECLEEVLEELEQDLKAKQDILHYTETLMRTSKAALRARYSEIIMKIETYIVATL